MSKAQESLDEIGKARAKLARTRIRSTLQLSPSGSVSGELAGVLGEYLLALVGMFHDRAVCRRLNVAVTEFVTNAISYTTDPEAELRVDVLLEPGAMVVEVTNKIDDAQYAEVEARVKRINTSPNVKVLLRDTIAFRRARQLKGGLGMLRLASENKFVLSVRREGDSMTIRAEHAMEAK